MRLLLDTHFAIWLSSDESRLTDLELEVLDRSSTQIFISTVSLWELGLKWRKFGAAAKSRGLIDPADLLTFAAQADWEVLPLRPAHVLSDIDPPAATKDPFDEVLLMQAQEEGLRLLTRDSKLLTHPLAAPLH